MASSLIVAVDPGFGGAIAFLRNETEPEVVDMPFLELTLTSKVKKMLTTPWMAAIRQRPITVQKR